MAWTVVETSTTGCFPGVSRQVTASLRATLAQEAAPAPTTTRDTGAPPPR